MATTVRTTSAAGPAARAAAEKTVIVDSIRAIAQELRAAGRPADDELGITAAQVDVLRAIAAGSPCSINDIAERTFTHQSTVSSIVARLAQAGLISRAPSRDDGRRQAITLTQAGKRGLRQAPVSSEERLLAALRGMSRDELRRLASFLGKLSSALVDRTG
jgi:DNA-binding MarR family transcriptional regulator